MSDLKEIKTDISSIKKTCETFAVTIAAFTATITEQVLTLQRETRDNKIALKEHKDNCTTRWSNCQSERIKDHKLDKRAVIGWIIVIGIAISSNIIAFIK